MNDELTKKTGFGLVILGVFCPPLYFLLRGRWIAGLIHSLIYFIAILTLLFGGIGVLFWFMGFTHVYWDFAHVKQEQVIQRQASVMAERMAGER